MKITRIEPIAICLPMAKPIKMAGVEVKGADNVLVRIETDDGIVGWSEATSAPTGETVESMMAAAHYLAPYFAGSALDIAGAAARMGLGVEVDEARVRRFAVKG